MTQSTLKLQNKADFVNKTAEGSQIAVFRILYFLNLHSILISTLQAQLKYQCCAMAVTCPL